jgi:hypothetical protein
MISVQLRHHSLHEKARADYELLDIGEDSLGPFQFDVICNNHHALPTVRGCLHPTLNEDFHALTFVAGTPRRVRVKAVKIQGTGESIQTIIRLGPELRELLFVSEPSYRAANSLIKIKDNDF